VTVTLLDSNVLIALAVEEHVHHAAADAWLQNVDQYATCPITQGSLVRLLLRRGQNGATARALLKEIAFDQRHEFWTDDVSYADVNFNGVIGHRQVTDAYLAQLARVHSGRLATFDQGLAKLHGDVAELVPV
jgi:uncharacterized protein